MSYAGNRSEEIAARFGHASTQLSIRADLNLIDAYDAQIDEVERTVLKNAKINDPVTLKLLRTIPAVGNFLSYARLVRCEHESAGKKKGSGGKKIGNAHLKWAFSDWPEPVELFGAVSVLPRRDAVA